MLRVVHPGSGIPDPGVKKAPDLGSVSATLSRTAKKVVGNLPLLLLFSLYGVLPSRRYLMAGKNLYVNMNFKFSATNQLSKPAHFWFFLFSVYFKQSMLGMEQKIFFVNFVFHRANVLSVKCKTMDGHC
jgi:hypothetical protein